MSAPFEQCLEVLDRAIDELFDADPQIQAVGIARHDTAFGFKAVKNAAKILPASALSKATKPPKSIKKIPVVIEEVSADVEISLSAPVPMVASFVPEQQQHRPIVCGLQVQNVDDDDRQRRAGRLGANLIIIGTLGCFVRLADGTLAILSNNHVLAGENRGRNGHDRILQPGNLTFTASQHIATLTNFIPLNPSPSNARPANGNVVFNTVDAAVATVQNGVAHSQSYLPVRGLPNPNGIGTARVGDRVFKVGRTTGLTYGTITAVGITVGPIPYDPGNVWFRQQIEVMGNNGTMFCNSGDSGSIVVRTTGEVLGLLYATNGTQTYVSPIQTVFAELGITLA